MKKSIIVLLITAMNLLFSQDFTDISAGLTGVNNGNADWGDYDNDGDLDVFVSGETGSVYISKIYRNTNGVFTDINAGLTGAVIGSSAWGDFDNDGDLDIIIAGSDGTVRTTKIYRNTNGVFTDINAGLTGVWYSSVAWGDYNNDGDLDILLTGVEGSTYYSIIYRNENGSFTDINAGLQGVYSSSCAWIDYDKDGDLDVFTSGASAAGDISRIYRNDSGVFTDISAALQGVHYSAADWGDYDNDSDPDLILTGSYNSVSYSIIYRNDAGIFTNIGAGLQVVWQGSADWGDYDNDGDLDVVLTGTNASVRYSKIYRNDNGVFTDINAVLTTVSGGSSEWGDYDNDGDLDILITGSSGVGYKTLIFRNNSGVLNTPPSVPTGLLTTVTGYDAVVTWQKAIDVQTPQNGLSYNIYISSEPGTCDTKSPMGSISTGVRKIVAIGNTSQKRQWTIKGLSPGTYYWSVQAIDHAFAGSAFAAEGSFFTAPEAPVATEATNVTMNGFKANWNTVENSTGYKVTIFDNVSFWEQYDTTNNWYDFSGLLPDSTYYYYVMAYNSSGNSSASNGITVNTLPQFTDINAGLTAVYRSSVDWGDYDNDGDLDILLSGAGNVSTSKIYRNDSGSFTDINSGLLALSYSSAVWGDCDNDGDLDVFLSGINGSHYSRLYINSGSDIFYHAVSFLGLSSGSAAWGDYDNDGDLDILYTGTNGTAITKIIRKDGSNFFTDIGASIIGVYNSSVAWGDYDNDGDLDVLISGYTGSAYQSKIYRNDSGLFTDIGAGLLGLGNSSVDWGDYDNDGDLDILLTGYNGIGYSKIYQNNSGVFTDKTAGLIGVYSGSSGWGDYDNDGDLDILLTGYTGSAYYSKIYRNDSGTFTDTNQPISGVYYSSVKWGDYDNDSDLDFLTTGYNGSYISKIYKNNSSFANTAPSTPVNLSDTVNGFDATLSWDKAIDSQTSQNGLSYNLYISSDPGTCDTKSPMSDIPTGYRKVVRLGNIGQKNTWSVKNLPGGTYYWSVQAVDNAYAGSAFAAENTFFTALATPVALNATNIASDEFTANWSDVENTNKYNLQVSTSVVFSGYTEYEIVNYPIATSKVVDYLSGSTTYYYRLRAYNYTTGYSSYSNTIIVNTLPYFNQITPDITALDQSSSAWGDYDNDGDLDILVTGRMGTTTTTPATKVFRNDSGTFTDINIILCNMQGAEAIWFDYDNDSDLDIIMGGWISYPNFKIFKNNSGTFSDIGYLGGPLNLSFDLGDYDSDGDSDLLIQGSNSSVYIYKNESGTFTNKGSCGITQGLSDGTVDWCDYDNDGDVDVLLTGSYGTSQSNVYRNDNGIFTNINAGLTGVSYGSADWGDYDSDGDMDILITGYNSTSPNYYSKIYRNDSGIFTDIGAAITGVSYSSAVWGDYDNDGYLDVFLCGYTGTQNIAKVYKGPSFTEINTGMTGVQYGSLSLSDYDNDNDLDVYLSGNTGTEKISRIYINNTGGTNTKPTKPSGLVTKAENDSLILTFNASTDAETYSSPLSYSIDLTINGNRITPANSDMTTGYRKIVRKGDTTNARKFIITDFDNLPQEEKSFKWKVQAVDKCFAGSEFASSNNFYITSPRDLSLSTKTVMIETDLLKWEYAYSEYVDNYIIQLDDDPYFGSPIEQIFDPSVKKINAIKPGDSKTLYLYLALNELTDFGEMISNETYYWRVKPVYTKTNCVTIFTETPRSFLFNPTGTAPNPPVSGFNPANDDIESSLPKLSWNNAIDPDGHAEDLYYICQLDTVSTFTTIQYADTTAAGITSVQIASALPEGYRYYYRVKTVDADALQSVWSAYQTFLVVMPPQDVKITDDGTNVNLTWDAIPVNTKGVVYTVYSSANPYAEFPAGWIVAAAQLTSPAWSEPHSAAKKFYRITAGSSSK